MHTRPRCCRHNMFRRKSKAQKDQEAADDAAANDSSGGSTKRLDSAQSAVEAACAAAADEVLQLLAKNRTDDSGSDPIAEEQETTAVRAVLASCAREAAKACNILFEGETAASRGKIRQLEVSHKLKIETLRTAGQVSLGNQAAEMQAAHSRALEAQIASMAAGNDDDDALNAALNEAHAESAKLRREVDALRAKMKKLDEAVAGSKKVVEALQRDLGKAEDVRVSEVGALEEKLAEARAALQPGLEFAATHGAAAEGGAGMGAATGAAELPELIAFVLASQQAHRKEMKQAKALMEREMLMCMHTLRSGLEERALPVSPSTNSPLAEQITASMGTIDRILRSQAEAEAKAARALELEAEIGRLQEQLAAQLAVSKAEVEELRTQLAAKVKELEEKRRGVSAERVRSMKEVRPSYHRREWLPS